MTFAFPLAFVALLAVPALVAIYWLRSRHKRQPVSTLMLWMDQREAREGGLLIHRLQTPLLFFLELLTILLLILAAARPAVNAGDSARSLTVVLDDSFSMLAGSNDSSRSRALAAVEKEIDNGRYSSIRLIVAGETPQILGEAARVIDHDLLKEWRCQSPSADLAEAISFAFALGGPRPRVLVATDQPPPEEPADGRLEWWAFGKASHNVAFVNATRSARDPQERCLLEVANLSRSPVKTGLVIGVTSTGENTEPKELKRSTLELAPSETRRILLRLEPGAGILSARLDDDALAIDNQIALLPVTRPKVRVELRFQNETLKGLVEKAIVASGRVTLTSADPELILTDQREIESDSTDAWLMQFVADGDAESYLGPFVVDRAHPLAEGLSLDGVVWGAGKATPPANTAVVTTGNIPLLTDVARLRGRHELKLHLRPDLSTLQDTPNWPILIWNLIDWRASTAPGLKETNLRLGADANLTVGAGTPAVEVRSPDNRMHELVAHDRALTFKADSVGIYEISAAAERYSFASNALRQEESDLEHCVSGRWGDWQSSGLQAEERSISWIFLMLALITLAIHLGLTSRAASARAK